MAATATMMRRFEPNLFSQNQQAPDWTGKEVSTGVSICHSCPLNPNAIPFFVGEVSLCAAAG